jgi:thiol:disulfide interchange protein
MKSTSIDSTLPRVTSLRVTLPRFTPRRSTLLGAVAALSFAIPALSLVAQSAPPPVPAVAKHIYPEISKGQTDVDAALRQAAKEHKRVLLIFGGDWCGDCQVLDINLHDPANAYLLAKKFVVVHVNVGHMDENVDLAAKFGVPLNKGVPAVSVADPGGKVVHAQATGEFSRMRHMDPRSVNEFLNQWKA